MSAATAFSPLDLCSFAVSLPKERSSTTAILEQERAAYHAQLLALSPTLRERLTHGLGIETVATMTHTASRHHAAEAAGAALERAELSPSSLGLIIDYSTLAADEPEIWSLAHHLQGTLGASRALALGASGSGCAGLHLAWLLSSALLQARPDIDYALLIGADRAPEGGRCCLPVSIMADAASAVVVARRGRAKRRVAVIEDVALEQSGRLATVLRADRDPLRISIDGERFEQQVLPLHFVILHRLLSRSLARLGLSRDALSAYVYPNTTRLDRESIARGFDLDPSSLIGPGPLALGHAFASDLLINAESWLQGTLSTTTGVGAWLAAGSGFTWGAAIVKLVR